MGVDLGQWLRLSGLDETQLADPALHMSHATFQRLFLDAVAMAREPALGLFVGERLVGSTHGIVGYAMLNSGTLREALGLLAALHAPAHAARRLVDAVASQRGARPRHGNVSAGRTRAHAARGRHPVRQEPRWTRARWESADVQYVAFPFPAPRYASLARQFFRCEVRYAQAWAGFALPARTLDVPLRLADPAAFQEAARICQQELDKLAASDSTALPGPSPAARKADRLPVARRSRRGTSTSRPAPCTGGWRRRARRSVNCSRKCVTPSPSSTFDRVASASTRSPTRLAIPTPQTSGAHSSAGSRLRLPPTVPAERNLPAATDRA